MAIPRVLKGSLEDNTLTYLCWDAVKAPWVARQITADMFSIPEFRNIARFAMEHIAKFGQPPRGHLRDYLEEELKRRDGSFLKQIIDGMDVLHPELQGDFVQADLDRFITKRMMAMSLDGAFVALDQDDIEMARFKAQEAVDAAPAKKVLRDPWAEPVPPTLDLTILPRQMGDLRNFVEERAETIGVDMSGLFWCGLNVCGAALDGSIRMYMKQHDRSFRVPPAWWLLLIGDPSTGRSPLLDTCWGPIHRLQGAANERYAQEMRAWQADDEAGPKPHLTRYMMGNTTIEAIQDILTGQDRGIALVMDEWAELLASFSRYGNGRGEGDRMFYNQGFNGGSYLIDRGRASRGQGYSAVINNLLITVCGAVNPKLLLAINAKDRLTDDGLLQRSLPIFIRKRVPGTRGRSGGREVAGYEALIEMLARHRPNGELRLSEDAEIVRERFEREMIEKWESNDKLGYGFNTFAGKLPGIWGRLSLVLSRLIEPELSSVSAVPAELAERLIIDQVLPHAGQFYNWLGHGDANNETTRAIAGYVLISRGSHVTASDLKSNVRACRGMSLKQVQEAVSYLSGDDILIPDERQPPERRNKWRVHPDFRPQFAARAANEKLQRMQARRLIQGDQGTSVSFMSEPDKPDRFAPPPVNVVPLRNTSNKKYNVVTTTTCARAQSGLSGSYTSLTDDGTVLGDVEATEVLPLDENFADADASQVQPLDEVLAEPEPPEVIIPDEDLAAEERRRLRGKFIYRA